MFRMNRQSTIHPNGIEIAIYLCLVYPVYAIDPYSRGGLNIEWKMRPNRESISHLMGWRDLEGFRILRADDSHYGDRFGRTVVLRGSYLVVGAGAMLRTHTASNSVRFLCQLSAHR
jgi:hypothetical protein